MNKNILYIAIAVIIGLGAGWLIFGKGSSDTMANKDISDMSDQHDHSGETEDQMWTCSMHPQIMQPEAGDCPICGMDLIPAEAGVEGLAANEIKMTENAMALANIQTTIVGNLQTSDDGIISLSGKIAANEENNTVQANYFKGRIERLNVNYEGQQVNRGQLLATIYAPDLVAAQQELITAASLKASQPALYKAVRNKLKNWKLSDSQINSIEESGTVRENFPIYATVSGTVSEVMAAQGDYVNQGQPIVKLSNLNSVWAEFDAYERQISQLKEGQKVTITSNAYPNKEFEASVSFIDPTLNTKSRTVSVRATLNNKENLLKPGMFVTAKVAMTKGNTMESAISIPATAVMWTGERSLVYVKTNPNEPVFEMQEVTLGTKNGENYTIIEGLSNGDEVVTNGTFTVDAAAQLQGKKSMMNASGGKTMTGHEGHLGMENLNNTVDAAKRMDVASKFQEQLKTVFDDYIMLKTALTNDQSEKAKTAAQTLQKSLTQVDLALLKDKNANNHWAQLEKELKASSNEIAQTSDIKTQRNHFISLSAHLINAMKAFGINQEIYIDFCPMANNNEGAYWLSTEKKIQNPYYGQAMLKCGEVTETVQ
ncbi:membrane fusion protein, Cu(I)/Ag(I) efflux system [Gillisia sp. Hel1_33_143]|uniref:efflux RND transporter periplasmic adaptor subunit n=1 Tax=Gillisia sp. Hel1_33_143 TaxID=1336796 RepID=UPI00087971D8|nr:efflux RND transporter periplasmic adaptor subunit [Gillisia sp. Hel1_33_143]SDR97319.1 membrane fusion protein, Cu(I)/Ag(I) efflux system [Gillisia sp. Hel1_33_143]